MKKWIARQYLKPQRHRETEIQGFPMAPHLCASVVRIGFGSFAAKTLLFFSMLSAIAILQGCSYPDPAKVEQKDSRPAIGVAGAPEGALLYVDGLNMGPVSSYNGTDGVLLVESGKHLVEIKTADGELLFKQETFLSNSTTKIIDYRP